MASAATLAVQPPIVPMKISHCGEGSVPAYLIMTSIAPSLSREKLWDFQ